MNTYYNPDIIDCKTDGRFAMNGACIYVTEAVCSYRGAKVDIKGPKGQIMGFEYLCTRWFSRNQRKEDAVTEGKGTDPNADTQVD